MKRHHFVLIGFGLLVLAARSAGADGNRQAPYRVLREYGPVTFGCQGCPTGADGFCARTLLYPMRTPEPNKVEPLGEEIICGVQTGPSNFYECTYLTMFEPLGTLYLETTNHSMPIDGGIDTLGVGSVVAGSGAYEPFVGDQTVVWGVIRQMDGQSSMDRHRKFLPDESDPSPPDLSKSKCLQSVPY